MKHIPIGILAVAFALTFGRPAPAQDSASIVGVWKVKSIERKIVESGKVEKNYGENPGGILVCTKGGRMTIMAFHQDRTAVVPGKTTNEERSKLFTTMYAGYGRCSVEGTKLVLSYDRSWHEAWSGKTFKIEHKVEGNTLTFATTPLPQPDAGLSIVTTVYERME
jgi:hypothetical protein